IDHCHGEPPPTVGKRGCRLLVPSPLRGEGASGGLQTAKAGALAERPGPENRLSRAYLDCISLRLYLTVTGAPSEPSMFWILYCHSISAKFRLHESTGRLLAWASPLVWKLDTRRSVKVTLR